MNLLNQYKIDHFSHSPKILPASFKNFLGAKIVSDLERKIQNFTIIETFEIWPKFSNFIIPLKNYEKHTPFVIRLQIRWRRFMSVEKLENHGLIMYKMILYYLL